MCRPGSPTGRWGLAAYSIWLRHGDEDRKGEVAAHGLAIGPGEDGNVVEVGESAGTRPTSTRSVRISHGAAGATANQGWMTAWNTVIRTRSAQLRASSLIVPATLSMSAPTSYNSG